MKIQNDTPDMNEQEYLKAEERHAVPVVRMLLSLVRHAATMPDDMGWKEHEQLLEAYRNGLDWYENHHGGAVLNRAVDLYITRLHREGYCDKYERSVFEEVYEEKGLTNAR
jgi:hypothetical protein